MQDIKIESPKSTGGHPKQKKTRPLTIKEHAVVEGKLKGKDNVDIGLTVYNTTKPINAGNMVSAALKREVVQNEIEKRLAAQHIYVDRHLKNIDDLAFKSKKDDVKLRASQDLADRAGAHYKYVAEENKDNLNSQLTDEAFKAILEKHSNK